jgi:hypothetical protein
MHVDGKHIPNHSHINIISPHTILRLRSTKMVLPTFLHVLSLVWLTIFCTCICKPLPASSVLSPRQAFRPNQTFEYVVVGGGTAGLTIASRLAQGNRSVAVIEAGGFYQEDIGDLATVPAFAVYGAGASPDDIEPSVDWGFVSTPQAVSDTRSTQIGIPFC